MWDSIKAMAISQLATLFIDRVDWEVVLRQVADIATREISGAEKRRLVLAQLSEVGKRVGASLLNFGIELAVQWIRLQQKK